MTKLKSIHSKESLLNCELVTINKERSKMDR